MNADQSTAPAAPAASLPALAVHALLNDHPLAGIGHHEPVQIEIEAVLHGGAVHLGNEPARRGERGSIEPDAISDPDQLVRGLAGVSPAAAADVDPELARKGREAALECADDAGGDARGVPVHSHHGPERLEPEGVVQESSPWRATLAGGPQFSTFIHGDAFSERPRSGLHTGKTSYKLLLDAVVDTGEPNEACSRARGRCRDIGLDQSLGCKLQR